MMTRQCTPHFTCDNYTDLVIHSTGGNVFETLYRYNASEDQWQAHYVLDTYDFAIPHLACMVCDSTVADDNSLLNSEVTCATAIMTGRLRLQAYEHHQIVPVCTYRF